MSRLIPWLRCLVLLVLAGCADGPLKPWAAGKRYVYEAQMGNEAATQESKGSALFDFQLRGELAVVPLEVSKERTRLLLSFPHVTFDTKQGAQAAERFERVARELAHPHVFTYVNGVQTTGSFPKDAEAVTVAIMRTVAAELQLAPRPEGQDTWEAFEYDATGRYQAEYRTQKGEGGTRSVARKKLHYGELILDKRMQSPLMATARPTPKISLSEGALVFGSAGMTRLTAREQIEVELMPGHSFVSRTSLGLRLARSESSPAEQAAAARDNVVLAATETYQHASAVFDLDQAKIGGRTFAEVVSSFEALAAETQVELVGSRNGKPADREQVERAKAWGERSQGKFVALAALLRADPTNVERVVAIVRGRSAASLTLISGLGASGTEPAQRALLTLMNDTHLPEQTREAAAMSLIRSKNPAVSSAEALTALMDDPIWSEYAELGLGTYVRLFGESGRNDAMDRFGSLLVARLRAATTDSRRIAVLTAISNSGYVPALEAIKPLLEAEAGEVRAAAVQALRLMQHPSADLLIAGVLARDPDTEVRVGALVAVRNRSFQEQLFRGVRARLESDPEVTVRLRALEALETWAEQHPPVLVALERAAEKDTSSIVRDAAVSTLRGVGQRSTN